MQIFAKMLDKKFCFLYNTLVVNRGVAQFGRALRSGRRGRRFESCHLDQKVPRTTSSWNFSLSVFCMGLNMTLTKLAKIANVSVSTASKAFSGSDEVNNETKEMIFEVAREYGCFKKFYNAKYPKLMIAVIAPEFKSAYYSRYLTLLQENLEGRNCELCVSTTDFSVEREEELIEYYYKHSSVDGIIIICSRSTKNMKFEIPLVYISPATNHDLSNVVTINIKSAMSDAVNYLLDKDVTSIGYIGETLTKQKKNTLCDILTEKGISLREEFISISSLRFETGGYDAMNKLFALDELPRAIICGYDSMAIGAIRCILDKGLSVPEDIAILGIDDISMSEYLNPPLSSISSCLEELCEAAVNNLIELINNNKTKDIISINSKFHLRRSFEID